jgi:hypothetical protein
VQHVTNTSILDRYADGVMARALHHAPNVNAVVPALRGFVECYGQNIALYGDGTSNVAWFHSKRTNQRFAFSYSHAKHAIELRRGSTHGPVVATFDNATPNDVIDQIFRGL